ncbi:MAG: hypothetical protein H6810_07560 [Phycisphaeraceae bacterium]|nr:MAG: hypothetical protein H6810_07560 [Phycisphaeraceae bacterium]
MLASAPSLAALSFFIAGVLKLASLDAFGRSVRTWDLLSPAVMDLVTLAVPPLEVAVSLAWLMNLRRRLCASLMFAMLLVLTLTYSAHLVFRQPPDCGCFGAIRLFEAHQEQAEFLIARNVVLAVLLLPGFVRRR